MATLRERASAHEPEQPRSAIDRLLVTHPDRADEILDLLVGEPRLGARIVAETLSEEFDEQVGITGVQRWRQKR